MDPDCNLSKLGTFSSEVLPRLSLVMIRAQDLEASVSFYSNLGLAFTEHKHGDGPVHYACDRGSWVMEIYPAKESEPTQNVVRIGFEVENLVQLHDSLQKMNVKVQSPPTKSEWGLRMVAYDPDSNRVELTQQ